ncbi:CsbD family protein [Bradyrhizobium sp. 1]|uniref:CsbD family protein n=1 Tax=Bradyrhizobium sp. 1 TaxID=241591 RepID=UPI001FF90799|nr:CsbD family protein [Bradyrhizobium sp. 1]MCK1392534.1 CsbD family protein [Bradyrhizobium sp. 1]
MGRAKDIKEEIVGKAKQTLGEIIGDQSLHEDGKAQAARGRDEQDGPRELNPLKKLNRLT